MSIEIVGWEKFQHPDVARNKLRAPAWIRVYTDLHADDNYLALSGHRRAVLVGLWLEYAKSRRQLLDDTASLSRRLHLRVTRADLDALNHAGFIHIHASNSQADAAQIHTLEERRKEQKASSSGSNVSLDPAPTRTRPTEPAKRPGLTINGREVPDIGVLLPNLKRDA